MEANYFTTFQWVLSYIDMNQPWSYMCSPSRSPLPPPSPSDPSGSSQCTRPKHLSHASHLGWWSVSLWLFFKVKINGPCKKARTDFPGGSVRIRLPMQGIWVRSPVPEDSTCCRAATPWVSLCATITGSLGFPAGSDSKENACNAGDLALIPGLGRSPGEGNGYLLQYPGLENSMDREAWRATVHGVAKSWTLRLTFTFLHPRDCVPQEKPPQ